MEFVCAALNQGQSPVPYSVALAQSARFKFGTGSSERLVTGVL
ncbi:MAG: hypothetical protein ACI88G_001791, partial [Woeseiaceae bacterium]